MGNIRAAFFDIDGTLLSFATHQVPPSTLRALKEMKAAGIKLFIASGRPPFYMKGMEETLGVPFDGYVLTNGQCCTDGDLNPFYIQALPKESVPALLRWLEAHPDTLCAFCEDEYVYLNRPADLVEKRCEDAHLNPPRHPVGDPARALTHTTYQLNLYMPPEMDAPFAEAVPGYRAVRWNPVFADVIPADRGQAHGLARLMARHGLTADQCIAFGDGGNDIEMLRAAGTGVAMGNASPTVQAAADYVTDTVDRDGIWKAVVHFGLIQD